jgi:predicted secreted protein
MIKKSTNRVLLTILLSLSSISLLAAPATAVARLHGYIPETTTFKTTEYGIEVSSNQKNFTYSVVDGNGTSLLLVVAN